MKPKAIKNGEKEEVKENTDKVTQKEKNEAFVGKEEKMECSNKSDVQPSKTETKSDETMLSNKNAKDTTELREALDKVSVARANAKEEKKIVDKNKDERESVITQHSVENADAAKTVVSPDNVGLNDAKINEATVQSITQQMSTSATILEALQRALRINTTFAITASDSIGQFDLTFEGKPSALVSVNANKIVNGPPQILQLYRQDTGDSKIMHDRYYTKAYDGLFAEPIKKTLDLFAVGSSTIRVKADSINTTIKISHDPNQPISSSDSFMKPVLLTGEGARERTHGRTSIFSLINAVLDLVLKIVPSCRVIIAGMIFESVYDDVDRRGLINSLIGRKIPKDIGPHIIFSVGHPAGWFEDKVLQLIEEEPAQYVIGEINVDDYMMGQGKRRRFANLTSDAAAADLYGINYRRRQAMKMDLSLIEMYIWSFALPGTTIRRVNTVLNDGDYEISGICDFMFDAYIFLYIMSNSFKNQMTTLLQSYAMSFGIVRMRQMSEIVADIQRISPPASISRHLTLLQSKFPSISPSSFINVLVANLLSAFYNVRIKPRAAHAETDIAVLDLLSNLVLLFLFPSITRQNLHILAFNICSILYSLKFPEMETFLNRHGFAEGHRVPVILTDNEYFDKKIVPKIFDIRVRLQNMPVIAQIRSLILCDGKVLDVTEQNNVKHCTLEDKKSFFMPWQKICRKDGYAVTPLKLKFNTAVDICNKVAVKYNLGIGRSRSDTSGTLALLQMMDKYVDEFCQFMHHEGYDLYYFIAMHMGFMYDGFKSNNDITKPDDTHFGIISTEQTWTKPWAPFKQRFDLDWTFGLSSMLTIVGVLKTITDRTNEEIKVNWPDPVKQFNIFRTILQSCAEIVEPFAILRNMLHVDYKDSVTNLIKHTIHKAGIRESSVNLMRKIFSGRNVPDDMFGYAENQLFYSNRLIMTKPKMIKVNRSLETVSGPDVNIPSICDRELNIEDPFVSLELEVAMKTVLSEHSVLLKVGKGIIIQRCKYSFVSPSNRVLARPEGTLCVKLKGEQCRLLTERFVDGKLKIGYEDIETGRFYSDFEDCEFPRIHFIAPHPEYVSHTYLEGILRLIQKGYWSFEFTDFWFQATVAYVQDVPSTFHMSTINAIMNTSMTTICDLIFPDTKGAIYNIYDKAVLTDDVQYVFTTANLENDVILKNINGTSHPTAQFSGINEMNWQSGDNTRGLVQKFSANVRKIDTGIPNFLNGFVIDNTNAYIRELPEYEVNIPIYYFDSN